MVTGPGGGAGSDHTAARTTAWRKSSTAEAVALGGYRFHTTCGAIKGERW